MNENTALRKVTSLFEFIHDMALVNRKTVTNLDDQPWHYFFNDALNNKYIELPDSDITQSAFDIADNESVIIKVSKPILIDCPEPPDSIRAWLRPGWEKSSFDVQIIEQKSIDTSEDSAEKSYISFGDSNSRLSDFKSWMKKREQWATDQKEASSARKLFQDLYTLYNELQQESERIEFMIGSGVLRVKNAPEIKQPILIQKVRLVFDAENNKICILNVDSDPELDTLLIQSADDINYAAVQEAAEKLKDNPCHPLDKKNSGTFLKILTHQLSANSEYIDSEQLKSVKNEQVSVTWAPVFFVRRRPDGSIKAIERILKYLDEFQTIPKHILELVGKENPVVPENSRALTIDEQLAESCGESNDILLAKDANREQLEIAKKIEQYNAVLVQGPPGTGKTHTIANLLGNFLAEGKSVLITSQKPKALAVLKDKVPEEIQALCVSMLDDTNLDMRKSIDDISDYSARHTSSDLIKQINVKQDYRNRIFQDLADTRNKMYQIRCDETKSIIYNGKGYTPIELSKYVSQHTSEYADYIPGPVELFAPFPLTTSELIHLYHSNEDITLSEEHVLSVGLPELSQLISPEDFDVYLKDKDTYWKCLTELGNALEMSLITHFNEKTIIGHFNNQEVPILQRSEKKYIPLSPVLVNRDYSEWELQAIADGKRGGFYRERWTILVEKIIATQAFREKTLSELLGKKITIGKSLTLKSQRDDLTIIKGKFEKSKMISKLGLLLGTYKKTYEAVQINGHPVSSAEDCQAILDYIHLIELREDLGNCWRELFIGENAPAFESLGTAPEEMATSIVPDIQKLLNWYNSVYYPIVKTISEWGFSSVIWKKNASSPTAFSTTEQVKFDLAQIKRMTFLTERVIRSFDVLSEEISAVHNTQALLQSPQLSENSTVSSLSNAIINSDSNSYQVEFANFSYMCNKSQLQDERQALLNKIQKVAPEWANAIKQRKGIHGLSKYPENIEDAWKWKQFNAILSDLLKEPYDTLQRKAIDLSEKFHNETAQLAALKAWYNLLLRTESNLGMRQALNGWKKTQEKIGKGTGKKVPMLRKAAREQMSACQKAVPAWIMPMSKALDSFDIANNTFDIVIIDEASQSDLTSLAVLALAKKAIIVGDDKQVSPSGIGIDSQKLMELQELHIKGIVPNWQNYDAQASLYDIAMQNFQPLMLREHFRCVPDIIGYSNKLAYDFKIKPLREAGSSKLLPAVVSYRVPNGIRSTKSKTNIEEAIAITAIMKACMEQPEYNGQSFGVISLLGNEQVQLIQREIYRRFEPSVIEERKILWGNAAQFQGDERDVILLSMVDSSEGGGPLRLTGEGPNRSTMQRYNVATSRARNQLWVVNSLDYKNDLQKNDIRRGLLEYAENPSAIETQRLRIEAYSDSPFEQEVAEQLVARGYHIEQQYAVGSYRIDMIVKDGTNQIALECDGDRYHSGPEKVREDMERQTILERVGWHFIRIRGSEYYRNPKSAMERIYQELELHGIHPEECTQSNPTTPNSELLQRVKIRTHEILNEWKESNGFIQSNTDTTEKLDGKSHNKLSSTPSNQKESSNHKKDAIGDIRNIKFFDYEKKETSISTNKPPAEVIDTVAETPSPRKRSRKSQDSHKKLLSLLELAKFKIIDNYSTSGIVWVIIPKDNFTTARKRCEAILELGGYNYGFEPRGSIQTNGESAFRVMFN